ncbi:MAG: bifunctional oligoribonuclease/PAP phosphatase NrnA [Verrucomicrobia bacterium]|jgi:phosphoesterase RecJ-like protein|nr:bifunctional oligoribonuclease/PAP phosphatase NrnA [Verrucomicrobiota bacterium]
MSSQPRIVRKLLETIREHQTFCVVGHMRPDGDCIGSQLAMTLALRNEGKEAVCWNQDPLPQKYRFLDPERVIESPKRGKAFDCVIATDAATFDRLGTVADCVQDRKVLLNIDHHESNTRYGDVNWVSSRSPSTAELVYRLLRAGRFAITKPMADCLFTGVSTDTGSFQYPTTRPSTYHVAGDLVARGANLALICDEVYQSYPLSRARLLKHIYSTFRLTDDDRIAYFWLKKADFARTGAESADTEGLIDHIRDIEPVIVACVFEELDPERTRISLRSKSHLVNVSSIASEFGGGGHSAAAGATIPGKPLSVQRRVVAAIRRALHHSH